MGLRIYTISGCHKGQLKIENIGLDEPTLNFLLQNGDKVMQ